MCIRESPRYLLVGRVKGVGGVTQNPPPLILTYFDVVHTDLNYCYETKSRHYFHN